MQPASYLKVKRHVKFVSSSNDVYPSYKQNGAGYTYLPTLLERPRDSRKKWSPLGKAGTSPTLADLYAHGAGVMRHETLPWCPVIAQKGHGAARIYTLAMARPFCKQPGKGRSCSLSHGPGY